MDGTVCIPMYENWSFSRAAAGSSEAELARAFRKLRTANLFDNTGYNQLREGEGLLGLVIVSTDLSIVRRHLEKVYLVSL